MINTRDETARRIVDALVAHGLLRDEVRARAFDVIAPILDTTDPPPPPPPPDKREGV